MTWILHLALPLLLGLTADLGWHFYQRHLRSHVREVIEEISGVHHLEKNGGSKEKQL